MLPSNKNKKWSTEDDNYLKDNIEKYSLTELSEIIQRTECSIKARCLFLGIHNRKHHIWSVEDDDILKTYYPKGGIKACLDNGLNVSESAILNRVSKLGLRRITSNSCWSEEDIDILKSNYSSNTISELAKLLNRSEVAIRCKAIHLGLTLSKCWTKEEDDILLNYYLTHSYEELVDLGLVNRSKNAIATRVYKLGIPNKVKACWSEAELDILKKFYTTKKIHELQAMGVRKTYSSIQYMANKLNLKKLK